MLTNATSKATPITDPRPPNNETPPRTTAATDSERQAHAQCGLSRGNTRREHDRSDGGKETAEYVREDLDPIDFYSRKPRGLLIATNRVNVTPEPGVLQYQMRDDENDQRHDEGRGQAPHLIVSEIPKAIRQAADRYAGRSN